MNGPQVLRDRDFRRFFVGQLVSLLGDQASVLAIPLTAVLVLHAGPPSLGCYRGRHPAEPVLLVVGRCVD